jgi:hypothetical protein
MIVSSYFIQYNLISLMINQIEFCVRFIEAVSGFVFMILSFYFIVNLDSHIKISIKPCITYFFCSVIF